MEQTRAFLAENRQSMIGIFKRFAKIGGAGSTDHQETISDLTKSYMALVAATGFLDVCSFLYTWSLAYHLLTNLNSLRIRKLWNNLVRLCFHDGVLGRTE